MSERLDSYYLYTFESTHGAIATEKILKPVQCTVMPVPRHISTSCGIAVRVEPDRFEESKKIFRAETDLEDGEYSVYRIDNDKDDKENGFRFEKIAI
jgi:hypothetical protein